MIDSCQDSVPTVFACGVSKRLPRLHCPAFGVRALRHLRDHTLLFAPTDGKNQKHKFVPNLLSKHLGAYIGQRTEQVKTGQLNPDRPLVGPSVDTFVGSPRRAEKQGNQPSWVLSWAGSWGHSWTHSWAHSWVKFRFRLLCASLIYSQESSYETRRGSDVVRELPREPAMLQIGL